MNDNYKKIEHFFKRTQSEIVVPSRDEFNTLIQTVVSRSLLIKTVSPFTIHLSPRNVKSFGILFGVVTMLSLVLVMSPQSLRVSGPYISAPIASSGNLDDATISSDIDALNEPLTELDRQTVNDFDADDMSHVLLPLS
jgi:hypothetical protein